jgi:hypothetical protein
MKLSGLVPMGNEATLFHFWEYINRILLLQCVLTTYQHHMVFLYLDKIQFLHFFLYCVVLTLSSTTLQQGLFELHSCELQNVFCNLVQWKHTAFIVYGRQRGHRAKINRPV